MKVTAGAAVLIERCVFDRNLGPIGGAVTLDTNSTAIIQVSLVLPSLPIFLFLNSLQTGCNQFVHYILHSFRHPWREGPAEINQHEIWLVYFSMQLLCPAGQPSNETDFAPPGCLPCPALPCPALPCPALPCPLCAASSS